MNFSEYKVVTVKEELGRSVAEIMTETMNEMAAEGWHVVCVHGPGSVSFITFGRNAG